MFSINFLHKIFMILTIMTTIPISYSILGLFPKDKLFRMIPKKDKFEDYLTHFEYKISTLKENEKYLKFDDYYKSIYDVEIVRIPKPSNKIDYDGYNTFLSNYCYKEFISIFHFKWLDLVSIIKYSITGFKDCLTDNILTIKGDETLKKRMIEALSWTPDFEFLCSNELRNYMETMNSCLRKNYSDRELHFNPNPTFVDCFSSLLTEDKIGDEQRNWMEYYIHNYNRATKYSYILLKNIRRSLLSDDKVKRFNQCLYSFKENIWPAFPGYKEKGRSKKPEIYLLDMYILLSIIYHHDYQLNHINMSLLYSKLIAEPEYVTPEDSGIRAYCKENRKPLNHDQYTDVMASYTTLPNILESRTYDVFKKKKLEQLDGLMKAGFRKEGTHDDKYINKLQQNIAKTTEADFKKMIKRRPIKDEKYHKYAARMFLRGFLPLPVSLWLKEKAIAHKSSTETMTNKEFTEDLKNLKSESKIIE